MILQEYYYNLLVYHYLNGNGPFKTVCNFWALEINTVQERMYVWMCQVFLLRSTYVRACVRESSANKNSSLPPPLPR